MAGWGRGGLSIHDKHDVTEEDVRAASYGDDFHYLDDVYRSSQPKRSVAWWRQYHASRRRSDD